jgi:phosphohistidine phosphatase
MILYVIRHGEALPVGGEIATDSARPLSERGEGEIAALGTLLAAEIRGDVAVLCSPLVRACRTAEIIAGMIDGAPAVRTTENLAPGFRVKDILSELAGVKRENAIVVGHQPDLGNLVSHLTAGEPVSVAFYPGGAAKITTRIPAAAGEATLHWLLTPDLVHRVQSNR